MLLTKLTDQGRASLIKNSMMLLLTAQVMLIGYLLAMNVSDVVLLLLFSILPIFLLCHLLLKLNSRDKYGEMSLIMFAAGGFGMLLGSVFDIGQLGPYALLSYCRANSLSGIFFDSTKIAQFITLMPWSFIGMMITGNLAMLFFDSMGMHHHMTFRQYVYIYLVCNVGMLFGMFVGEALASMIDMGVNETLAAAMMLLLMILGMTLGMLLLLYFMLNLMRISTPAHR